MTTLCLTMEWRLLIALVFTHAAYSQYAVVPELAPPLFLPSELTSGVTIPQIPGVAGVDYPIFSQSLVSSSFRCSEATPPGYYPDFESKCQLFHVCQEEIDQSTFICPNGTVFNDKHSVCDWWFNVQCAQPLAPVVQPYDYPTPAPVLDNYHQAPVNGNGRKMRIQQRTNRLRSGFLRNEAIVPTYGGPLEPTQVPEVQEIVEEVAAVVENHGYNGQLGISSDSGRRMRNQQRTNRFRSGFLRDEAIVQTFGGPLEPTSIPEVEEIVEEVAAVAENHGYNGQSAANNGNEKRNQQRFNRFRTNFLRNEEIGQSYGGPIVPPPPPPAPIQNSYHQQLPETVTEFGEVQEEVPSPLEVQEQSIVTEENERRMRFQQRNNRFRLKNEPIVQSYGGPLVLPPTPAPIQSSYHSLPETTPVIVEEENPAALETHGYNAPPTSGIENGRRMRNQQRNNRFRSSFVRNKPTMESYGGPLLLPPSPVVIEAEEEEVAAPLETQGYNGHPATNAENERKMRNRLRSNRMRTSSLRNEAIVQSYGGPLISPPIPVQNAYHQGLPEATPAAIEVEDSQGYNKPPPPSAENGRRLKNQQKNNRLRSSFLRNEPTTQTYGGPLVASPAPIQSSYHQAIPETTPVAVEEEEAAPLEAQGYNGHPVAIAENGQRLRNQQRNNRLRSNALRNDAVVNKYGGPLVAAPAPVKKAYPEITPTAIEETAPIESQTYNEQSLSSTNGNGRKFRIQQQLHRLRTNSMRNEAIAGSYGSPIKPTSAPEIVKEEAAAPLEVHGYQGQSATRNRNGRRLNNSKLKSKSMRNEPIVHSYSDASVSTPASVQHSYHHQTPPESIPAHAEIEPEAEVEAEEVIVEGATGERSVRNRLRSNRGKDNSAGSEADVAKPDYKLSGQSVEYGTGSASIPEMSVEEAAVAMEESFFGHRLRSSGRKQPRSGVSDDLAGTRYDPLLAPETEAEANPKIQPVF